METTNTILTTDITIDHHIEDITTTATSVRMMKLIGKSEQPNITLMYFNYSLSHDIIVDVL